MYTYTYVYIYIEREREQCNTANDDNSLGKAALHREELRHHVQALGQQA